LLTPSIALANSPGVNCVSRLAMALLCKVIQQTSALTLLTDGEKRYGSLLFEIWSEVLRTDKRGRPKKILRQGVKVRVKHKGAQRHQRGRKRPKYPAPSPEHPDPAQPLATTDMQAHHLEASIHRYVDVVLRIADAPIPLQTTRHDCKSDWMSTGLCIILFACILQHVKYLRWH
jgi:hypothetical protein